MCFNEHVSSRIEIVKKKIEMLQYLISELEKMNAGTEDNDTLREIDELFCSYYHSHPLPVSNSYYFFQDCLVCPLDSCYFRMTLEKVRKCFDFHSRLDYECRECEFVRVCGNVIIENE